MNKKAQALIEFVLILPVLIMLIFAFIDFGRIFVNKNQLESLSTSVVEYLKKEEDDLDVNNYLDEITDVKTNVVVKDKDDKYISIRLSRSIALITPGLNLILGNDYKVTCERVIMNEK